MPSKKKLLKKAKLYLILDAEVLEYEKLLRILKESVRFGIDIVQLRDKFGTAKDIFGFCRHALAITKHRVPLIVNDRADVAKLAGAEGVHVGQSDLPCRQVRRLMGKRAIIGVSCQTLAHAKAALADGADYIGFGSVFKTLTKPERNPMNLQLLRHVLSSVDLPVFPIGGINRGNISLLTKDGVTRAAVCRDILLADPIGGAIAEFRQKLRG